MTSFVHSSLLSLALLTLVGTLAAQDTTGSAEKKPVPTPNMNLQIKPGPGAGGTYRGPGDTVPPCSTNCGPVSPPPCWEPCCADFSEVNCWACDYVKLPTMFNAVIDWEEAPECFQGEAVRVYDITIGDLRAACAQSNGNGIVTSVCMDMICNFGVDSVFVYTTKPFQNYIGGVPAGNFVYPFCGMCYRIEALYGSSGYCDSLGTQSDSSTFQLGCNGSVSRLALQTSCSCLFQALDVYASRGAYFPGQGEPTEQYMTDKTVVFSVLVKCCPASGPECP